MSELTECNYCTLKRVQRKYDKKHVRWWPDGMTDGWIIVEVRDGKNKPWRRIASFKQLTTHCVC